MKNEVLKQRNYSRQSHAIINAKYALSPNEIDIVLILLTNITKEDEDFKSYSFRLKDLVIKSGRTWQPKQLQDTIISLMEKPIKIQTSPKKWEVIPWFSYFSYDNGICTCRFDKALKPYFIDLKGRFIISDIRHLLPMKSSYSKRMYLLLKEYAKFGIRTFNVEELQKVLKVPKSLLVYADFKRKVLKRTEQDLNKFSDLKVEFSEKKLGRKVVEVSFSIKKNDEDLKTFISMIRELYINVPLFITKEQVTVKCDKNGLLYNGETQNNFDKNTSLKYWEYMHENRSELLAFRPTLF